MSQALVVIVDYGLGNLLNVQRAFASFGVEAVISHSPEEILAAPKLVLPGVGAFGEGVKNLNERGLRQPIRDYAASGKHLMGICLGMQLLLSESEEYGRHVGLDLIKGSVRAFPAPDPSDRQYKVPHTGWSRLQTPSNAHPSWDSTFLAGLGDQPYVYFVHSYFIEPEDPSLRLATTTHGPLEFTSVIQKDNVMGCQFHPERSGPQGLKLLENFAKGLCL